eukprot:751344-Hanusia_phi.AAC.1
MAVSSSSSSLPTFVFDENMVCTDNFLLSLARRLQLRIRTSLHPCALPLPTGDHILPCARSKLQHVSVLDFHFPLGLTSKRQPTKGGGLHQMPVPQCFCRSLWCHARSPSRGGRLSVLTVKVAVRDPAERPVLQIARSHAVC